MILASTTDADQERQLDVLRKRVAELERWFATQDLHIRHLEQERKKLSALVSHADAGFILCDAMRRVTWTNAHFREKYGAALTPGHKEHAVCLALCNRDAPCGDCPLDRVLGSGEVAHKELQRDIEGKRHQIYATLMPIKDLEGAVGEVIIMLQDITDLEVMRESSRRLLASMKAAEAANHAKSEFLATMSHEIRTPLNGILGTAELLLDMNLDRQQEETARIIYKSAEILLVIVNDILDISKIEAGRMEIDAAEFDLCDVCEDVLAIMAGKAAEKNLALAIEFDAATPRRVIGDRTRVRQILLNLVGNAVKFTGEGGVGVRVRSHETDGARRHYRIEIEDSGIGIPPDRIEAVFDKFTQADSGTTRNFGGTGLGLSISRELARLMGGELTAVSELNRGSIFRCDIPLTVATSADAVKTDEHGEDPSSAGGTPSCLSTADSPAALRRDVRILVAEDNPFNQQVISMMCRKLHVPVTIAENGIAALKPAWTITWPSRSHLTVCRLL